MVIKAKGRTILRLIGAIFILIGLITSIFFNNIFLISFISYLMVVLITLPWFLFSTFLKLEIDLFTNNIKKVLMVLIIYSIIIVFLSSIQGFSVSLIIIYDSFTLLLLITCWHFSLSIYKREKLAFFFSGLAYIINIIILSSQLILLNHPIFVLDVAFVCFGMISVIIIEFNLRKKGLLTYI
jgi:hypothetical protein